MSVMKSSRASAQGDPVFMRRVNSWLTIFWLATIAVSLATVLVGELAGRSVFGLGSGILG
jgi:hypothetical protein